MSQAWRNSGTGCCSPCGTCALSFFCPCITYGRIHHRLTKDANLNGYSACNGSCCGYTVLGCLGFQWVMQMMQRGTIRNRYQLEGNGCTDCLCACCCTCCDLVQQDKEAASREGERGGLVAQQPGVQPSMSYGQPSRSYEPHTGQYDGQVNGQIPQQHDGKINGQYNGQY